MKVLHLVEKTEICRGRMRLVFTPLKNTPQSLAFLLGWKEFRDKVGHCREKSLYLASVSSRNRTF